MFDKTPESENGFDTHLHYLTCIKVVHPIEKEDIHLNIKFQ